MKPIAKESVQRHLQALEEWLETEAAKRNGAAYVAGIRLAANLHGELAEEDEGEPSADLTPDELVTVLLDAIPGLSDQVLDRLAAAVNMRRTPRLTVVG